MPIGTAGTYAVRYADSCIPADARKQVPRNNNASGAAEGTVASFGRADVLVQILHQEATRRPEVGDKRRLITRRLEVCSECRRAQQTIVGSNETRMAQLRVTHARMCSGSGNAHGMDQRALSSVSRTPTALAIAMRCSTALVEPPRAITIT